MILAKNSRPHSGRGCHNRVCNAISSVFLDYHKTSFGQVINTALDLRGTQNRRKHAANFLGRDTCREQRQQVTENRIVPFGEKLEGTILQGQFLVVASSREQFFQENFATVDIPFIAKIHQIHKILGFFVVHGPGICNELGIGKRQGATSIQNSTKERRARHACSLLHRAYRKALFLQHFQNVLDVFPIIEIHKNT